MLQYFMSTDVNQQFSIFWNILHTNIHLTASTGVKCKNLNFFGEKWGMRLWITKWTFKAISDKASASQTFTGDYIFFLTPFLLVQIWYNINYDQWADSSPHGVSPSYLLNMLHSTQTGGSHLDSLPN